jgi:DNA invertase Pin-like site-specific DNA recombinase
MCAKYEENRMRDKCEADVAVHDVHKKRPGRPRTAKSPASSAMMLEQFTRLPQKSAKRYVRERGISRSSVQRILKRAKRNTTTKVHVIYTTCLSLHLKTYTANNNMTFLKCKHWPMEEE